MPGNYFRGDYTFFLCLVREKLSSNGIADREHVWKIGPHLDIYRNLAALSERETQSGSVDSVERRLSSDRNENIVGLKAVLRTILFDLDLYDALDAARPDYFRSRTNLEPLLTEDLVGFLDDVFVIAGKN